MAAKKKTGVTTLTASKAARRNVAIILEALSGGIGTSEAAEQIGVTLSRYYQLESRALKGMLQSMEPKKRGFQRTPAHEIRALKAEKQDLEKELRRHQALLRAANRSLGLARGGRPKASSSARGAKRRDRGKTVLKTLRKGLDEVKGGGDGTPKRDEDTGGKAGGERDGA